MANKIIAGCLVFLCLLVGWEIYAQMCWEHNFDRRVRERSEYILQIHLSKIKRWDSLREPKPVAPDFQAQAKKEIREEGNPYSLFW